MGLPGRYQAVQSLRNGGKAQYSQFLGSLIWHVLWFFPSSSRAHGWEARLENIVKIAKFCWRPSFRRFKEIRVLLLTGFGAPSERGRRMT